MASAKAGAITVFGVSGFPLRYVMPAKAGIQ